MIGDTNINAWMVENGHAIAYSRYSQDYILQEKKAKELKLGIWQGTFTTPDNYRKLQRQKK